MKRSFNNDFAVNEVPLIIPNRIIISACKTLVVQKKMAMKKNKKSENVTIKRSLFFGNKSIYGVRLRKDRNEKDKRESGLSCEVHCYKGVGSMTLF